MTSEHNPYSDLIPDYLADLLDPEKKREFEQALAGDPQLRREVDEFASFQEFYQAIDPDAPEPSDDIFARISAAIEPNGQPETPMQQSQRRQPSLAGRLRHWWEQVSFPAALPWGVAVVQAAVIVILLLPATSPEQDTYKTLGKTPGAMVQEGTAAYNVVFAPGATETQIRDLLLDLGGSIVSGPSPEGRYVIAIPTPGAGQDISAQAGAADFVILFEPAY